MAIDAVLVAFSKFRWTGDFDDQMALDDRNKEIDYGQTQDTFGLELLGDIRDHDR